MTQSHFIETLLLPYLNTMRDETEKRGIAETGMDQTLLAGMMSGIEVAIDYIEEHRSAWL